MTRSPYQVSPGPEYIHALQNYKQLIDLNASVITFTSIRCACDARDECECATHDGHVATAGDDAARVIDGSRGEGASPAVPVRAVALDQSNKWSRLGQVRLSAARQTCTMLTARPLAPWVFQLGSRGNPAHLSNTAGDACNHCTPNSEQVS